MIISPKTIIHSLLEVVIKTLSVPLGLFPFQCSILVSQVLATYSFANISNCPLVRLVLTIVSKIHDANYISTKSTLNFTKHTMKNSYIYLSVSKCLPTLLLNFHARRSSVRYLWHRPALPCSHSFSSTIIILGILVVNILDMFPYELDYIFFDFCCQRSFNIHSELHFFIPNAIPPGSSDNPKDLLKTSTACSSLLFVPINLQISAPYRRLLLMRVSYLLEPEYSIEETNRSFSLCYPLLDFVIVLSCAIKDNSQIGVFVHFSQYF